MKTKIITDLKQHGFAVDKNAHFQTVVSHSNPFIIHGESGVYKAHLIEGKYNITFAGLCSSGEIPYLIEQTAFPLINDIRAKMDSLTQQSITERNNRKSENGIKSKKTLGDLVEGDIFYKNNESPLAYRKTGACTYTKCSSLVESIDLIGKPEMDVFVEMDMGLSIDQKNDIIMNMPSNLDRDSFDELLGMEVENVPGMEMMDDDELSALHDELFAMYQQHPQSSMEDEEIYSVVGDRFGTGVADVPNKLQAAQVARNRGIEGKLNVTSQPNNMLAYWKETMKMKLDSHPLLTQFPSIHTKYQRMVTNAKQSSMNSIEAQLKKDLNIDAKRTIDGTV